MLRLALLVLGLATPISAQAPNIVVILTDDQPYHSMEFLPRTLELLGAQGITFTNAMAAESICCPSRASLLTGLYSHHHKVFSNSTGAVAFEDESTVGTWLREAGYRTGFFGKYLNHYAELKPWPYVPPGWSDWRAHKGTNYFNYILVENGREVKYGSTSSAYEVDVVARHAVGFIETTPEDQPLFAIVAPYAPHGPATPAPRHAGLFKNHPGWRSPNYDEADVSDKPRWVRRLSRISASFAASLDSFYRRQLESLQSVDDLVVSVVDALERSGRLENTFVIFTADQGYSFGAHRWDKKSCVYEECTRTPLLIRGPGIVAREESRVVVNVDLAPTFAEIAGIAPGHPVDGASLLGLLYDATSTWEEGRYLELLVGGAKEYRAIRTERFLYAEYPNGDRELYDLFADPWQLRSVVKDAAYADTRTALAARLAAQPK